MIEFEAWPKIPRLFKPMVVTEKIDGTNAAVVIEKIPVGSFWNDLKGPRGTLRANTLDEYRAAVVKVGMSGETNEATFVVGAQSRNKLITPEQDNAGFARWAFENAEDLVRLLGPGRHFGEWWGSGIQRGYGLPKGEKRFSLFNRHRYSTLVSLEAEGVTGLVGLVPLLAEGPFDLDDVRHILADLRKNGSKAAPGFMNPEGVVVFHEAGRQVYKAFVEDDGKPKSLTAGAIDLAKSANRPVEQFQIPSDYLDALAKEPRGFA